MNLINFNNLNRYQLFSIICIILTVILYLINFNNIYLRKSDKDWNFLQILFNKIYVLKQIMIYLINIMNHMILFIMTTRLMIIYLIN